MAMTRSGLDLKLFALLPHGNARSHPFFHIVSIYLAIMAPGTGKRALIGPGSAELHGGVSVAQARPVRRVSVASQHFFAFSLRNEVELSPTFDFRPCSSVGGRSI